MNITLASLIELLQQFDGNLEIRVNVDNQYYDVENIEINKDYICLTGGNML